MIDTKMNNLQGDITEISALKLSRMTEHYACRNPASKVSTDRHVKGHRNKMRHAERNRGTGINKT